MSTCEVFILSLKKWIKISNLNLQDFGITSFYFAPNLLFSFTGHGNQIEKLNIDNKSNKWQIVQTRHSYSRPYGSAFQLNKNEVLIFGGNKIKGKYSVIIFNVNSLKIKKLKTRFCKNYLFIGSKPAYFNGSITIISKFNLDTDHKMVNINLLNLNFQETYVDFPKI